METTHFSKFTEKKNISKLIIQMHSPNQVSCFVQARYKNQNSFTHAYMVAYKWSKVLNLNTVEVSIVVQLLSHVQLFATPWTEAHQVSPSFAICWSLLKLISIESVTQSNHLILCLVSLFFSCLQSFPSSGSFPMSQLFAPGGHSITSTYKETVCI